MNPENDSDEVGAAIVREGAAAFWDDYRLDENPYTTPRSTSSHTAAGQMAG